VDEWEKTEDAQRTQAVREHLRRRRRIDGGDIVIYGGWVLALGVILAWFLSVVW
jgi:hypothetical protein